MKCPQILVEINSDGVGESYFEPGTVAEEVSCQMLFKRVKPALEGIDKFLRYFSKTQEILREDGGSLRLKKEVSDGTGN